MKKKIQQLKHIKVENDELYTVEELLFQEIIRNKLKEDLFPVLKELHQMLVQSVKKEVNTVYILSENIELHFIIREHYKLFYELMDKQLEEEKNAEFSIKIQMKMPLSPYSTLEQIINLIEFWCIKILNYHSRSSF